MKDLSLLPGKNIKQIKAVFFDIDDTFSLHSKILPEAFQSLWDLKAAGIKLVPITGRPAGWCDHIARMWPVDAIVGENGAFFFWCDNETRQFHSHFFDPEEIRKEKRKKLNKIKDQILSRVPGTGIASDQNYREADLAIDFCEDVAPLDWDRIEDICSIFEQHGATFKVSSIHVNGWFGQYSKIDMTRTLAKLLWSVDLDDQRDQYVFCGDSPNDEPMFDYFPLSIGVANLLKFEDRLVSKPAYITSKEGGKGFAQVAAHILSNR